MSWTYKVKIGGGQIEVQENDFKSIWSKAGFLNEVPKKCSACGSDNVAPMFKTPKGYEYAGMKCNSCGAEQVFHTKKDDGSPFIKWDDKFEKYSASESQPQKQQSAEHSEKFKDDDPDDSSIPF